MAMEHKMSLYEKQLKELKRICSKLSLENLVNLKIGNIKGIKNIRTKELDIELIRQHKEMKEIIKKEINKRNREKTKFRDG